jgi:hypothetical protein
MVTLMLEPEVEAALRMKAAVSEASLDELANMVLSRLILDDE